MKKALLTIISIATLICVTGCQSVQIFEHKDKLEYKEYKEDALQSGVYYVKDGTNFAPVYNPETKILTVFPKR